MRTWALGRWAVAAAVCVAVGQVRADGLADAIPANAKGAVILSNAKDVEKHLRAFAQSIGTPLPEGMGVDHLAQMAGVAGAWQPERGAALVFTAVDREGLALVLPVADSKEALKKLGAEADGGLYKLTVNGMPSVALPKKGLLIVAASAKGIEPFKKIDKPLGGLMQDLEKKVSAGADVFLYLNVPELKDTVLAGLDFFDQTLKPLIAQAGSVGGNDPAMMTRILDMYVKAIRQLVTDGRSFCLGLSVSGDRIQLQKGLAFKSDSTLAKYFQDTDQTSTARLIENLPSQPFFFAVGWDTGGRNSLWREVSAAMLKNLSVDPDKTKTDRMEKYLGEMFGQMQRSNMLMDWGEGGMAMLGHYEVKDPEAFLKLFRDNKNEAATMMSSFSPGAKVDVAVSSKKVGSLDVTEFKYTFSGLPAESMKMIKAMYGSETMRMQMAAVGKDSVGFASGDKGDPITKLEKPSSLTKEKRVTAALGDLPPKAGVVALLDVTGAIRAFKAMTAAVGQPIPIPLPDYDQPPPPVGVAVTTEKDGMIARVVVRADTVREVAKPFLGK